MWFVFKYAVLLWELLGIVADVLFQNLWMRFDKIPDLSAIGGPVEGLVAIVTGPTSGIGKETATELARRGAHVILACRSVSRGKALKTKLEQAAKAAGQPKPKLQVMQLDLSSLSSIREFAAAWEATGLPLHILINNAGILSLGAARAETEDGFESHIGTNHLGHFLLTMSLLPSLIETSKETGRKSRVVHVSSRLHRVGTIDRDDFQIQKGFYHTMRAYPRSKLAQVLFSEELNRRVGDHIISVALHPGNIMTEVVRTLPGFLQTAYRILLKAILLTPEQGARCTIHCATSPEIEQALKGPAHCTYYDSNCTAVAALTLDSETAQWVWDWSVDQVDLPASLNIIPAARSSKRTPARKNGSSTSHKDASSEQTTPRRSSRTRKTAN